MTDKALAHREEATPSATPMDLLVAAQQSGASIEQMQQLMDLQERWEAKEAKKAYNRAVADFRAEGIKIIKGKHVRFQTSKGVTEYDHATLGDVVEKVVPALSRHGLSHNWDMEQKDNGGIKVTCRLSHVDGHTESVWLMADPDESGSKNKIQQVASTVTYLQRYTFLAVTGLATHDQDDDGKGGPEETITKSQAADLEALLDEVGANRDRFLAWINESGVKIESLSDLPAKRFKWACEAAEAKRRK